MRSKLLIIMLLLAVAGSAVGLYQLFMLRFETGDLFPAGSSLRSDPLGSMALYQALERTADITVQRNYRSFNQQRVTASTILLLGNNQRELRTATRQEISQIEQLAVAGNRIVIAFSPVSPPSPSPPVQEAATQKPAETAWGIMPSTLPSQTGQTNRAPLRAALLATDTGLPPEAQFRSHLTLHPPANGWRVIYAIQEQPVLLERSIGNGSLVLVSDSSLFSNQVLKDGRQPALLAWLLGQHRTIIFDESHLGVTEQSGIMTLVRRFDLLPLVAVLLLLAGLYIWRASIALAPDIADQADERLVGVSHDSFNGLVNLLRRNIPPSQLLHICCQEWQRSFAQELKNDEQLRRIFNETITRSDDPLQAYQRIARLRAERNRR